jgi:hypothetical protein
MSKCAVESCLKPGGPKCGLCRGHARAKRLYGDPRLGKPTGRPLKGEVPGYDAAHKRIRRRIGPAATRSCCLCGQRADEWAYMGTDPEELTTATGLRYSLKVEHYSPACRPCHRAMDHSLDRARDPITGRWAAA